MSNLFGSRELLKFAKKNKMIVAPNAGTSHKKFIINNPDVSFKGQRTFLTIILNKKEYDKSTCSSYRRQLRELGFSKQDIEKYL